MKRYGPASSRALASEVASFQIFPGQGVPRSLRPPELTGCLYWRVRIFDSPASMRAYSAWRCNDPSVVDGGFLGEVLPLEVISFPGRKPGRRRKPPPSLHPRLGEVIFCRDHLGSEVICHEAVHVATSTLRSCASLARMGDDEGGLTDYLLLGGDIDQSEERLAYLIGAAARMMVSAMYDVHLLPQ